MPTLLAQPTRIAPAGNLPKLIDEFVGRVNSATAACSIARMQSPPGWREPGQTPAFDEYTLVLEGSLQVEHGQGAGVIEVQAGQAVVAHAGQWVRYSTPRGAVYIAICIPAFSPGTVHRDPE